MEFLKTIAVALPLGLASAFAFADDHAPATLEEVVKMLKAQQAEIEALKAELTEVKAQEEESGGIASINTPQSELLDGLIIISQSSCL